MDHMERARTVMGQPELLVFFPTHFWCWWGCFSNLLLFRNTHFPWTSPLQTSCSAALPLCHSERLKIHSDHKAKVFYWVMSLNNPSHCHSISWSEWKNVNTVPISSKGKIQYIILALCRAINEWKSKPMLKVSAAGLRQVQIQPSLEK